MHKYQHTPWRMLQYSNGLGHTHIIHTSRMYVHFIVVRYCWLYIIKCQLSVSMSALFRCNCWLTVVCLLLAMDVVCLVWAVEKILIVDAQLGIPKCFVTFATLSR
jgi:hypothetical protein